MQESTRTKYRLVMGIIAVVCASVAFLIALAVCILLVVANDPLYKVILLPLLIVAMVVTTLSALFSIFNIAQKTGIVALVLNAVSIVCLIISYTQLG